MTVTVVIPAYQAENLLTATLNSVASQTVKPDRVIVLDDGSTDATAEVARNHPIAPDVVVQENAGHAAARNHAVYLADSEWVAFLDADDLWHRMHLELSLESAGRTGGDFIAARSVSFVLADGSDPGPRARWADRRLSPVELEDALREEIGRTFPCSQVNPTHAAVTGVTPTPSTVLVRRRTLALAGGFPVLFDGPTDVACWFQVSRVGSAFVTDAPTTFYRIHGSAMSELGSESEVNNLAAFVAMWYGSELKPFRLAAHHEALAEFGKVYGAGRLQYLLAHAGDSTGDWRLRVERAFEALLVDDDETRRHLRGIRARRRLEIAAPRVTAVGRKLLRRLR